jgi:hypothetical protein
MRRFSRSSLALFSLIVAFLFILVMFIVLPGIFENNRLAAWHFALFGFLFFQPLLYMVMTEALCRQASDLYTFKFSLKTLESPLYDRMLNVATIALTALVPVFQVRETRLEIVLLSAAGWIFATELGMMASNRWARADFQHDLILVRGFNLRKHYGMSGKSMTTGGIYFYTEFESFSLKGEVLTLFLAGTGGRLRLRLPENISEPVAQYLQNGKNLKRNY